MYTQNDIDSINAQQRKRTLLWLIPELLLLASLIVSFINRIEWLTSVIFALLCAVVVFSLTVSILPVKRYRDFLRNAVHGRNRVDTVAFDAIDRQIVNREGVRFYPVTMRADTIKEELDERQYYWDANLPFPEWRENEKITLTSHERMITGWQRAAL